MLLTRLQSAFLGGCHIIPVTVFPNPEPSGANSMSRLPDLRKSKNLRDVREWLGLSLSQMASELPKTRGKKGHVSRAFVCLVQRGQRDLLPAQMEALSNLVKQQLSESRRDDIAIQIVNNSPWHIKVMATCVSCGKTFELRRITSRRCPRCLRMKK